MAPVFVLLQEVEGKRGGGPPRGSGTVGTTRARSCHGGGASGLFSQAARRIRDDPSDADGGFTLTGRWFFIPGESGGVCGVSCFCCHTLILFYFIQRIKSFLRRPFEITVATVTRRLKTV